MGVSWLHHDPIDTATEPEVSPGGAHGSVLEATTWAREAQWVLRGSHIGRSPDGFRYILLRAAGCWHWAPLGPVGVTRAPRRHR